MIQTPLNPAVHENQKDECEENVPLHLLGLEHRRRCNAGIQRFRAFRFLLGKRYEAPYDRHNDSKTCRHEEGIPPNLIRNQYTSDERHTERTDPERDL